MKKIRVMALCLLLTLLPFAASAAMNWRQDTEGQRVLKFYIDKVNDNLLTLKEQEVNSLFECYRSFAVMGITDLPDAEIPEEVEITVELFGTSINKITVRVSNPERFPAIAASFLQAAAPGSQLEDQLRVPKERLAEVKKDPEHSFEDEVTDLNGTTVYAYYAYLPNHYHDKVNWMQLTLVFPLEGYESEGETGITTGVTVTRGPDTYSGNNEDYDGYFSEDKYSHLDVYIQATPEPGSAAAEELAK